MAPHRRGRSRRGQRASIRRLRCRWRVAGDSFSRPASFQICPRNLQTVGRVTIACLNHFYAFGRLSNTVAFIPIPRVESSSSSSQALLGSQKGLPRPRARACGTILCVNLCAFVYGCCEGNGPRPTGGVGVAGWRTAMASPRQRTNGPDWTSRPRSHLHAGAGAGERSSIAVRAARPSVVFLLQHQTSSEKGSRGGRSPERGREGGGWATLKTRGRAGGLSMERGGGTSKLPHRHYVLLD